MSHIVTSRNEIDMHPKSQIFLEVHVFYFVKRMIFGIMPLSVISIMA